MNQAVSQSTNETPHLSPVTSVLLKTYEYAKRLGLIDNKIVRPLFIRSYFLYKRFFEDPFENLSKKHPAFFSGVVLDIGANVGYTASVFAKASPQVIAFEPDPDNFNSPIETLSFYRAGSKVDAINSAVGESNGEIKLRKNEAHHADHRILTEEFKKEVKDLSSVVTVPVVSIDSFLETKRLSHPVSFIKIDVQGYELPVCLGMTRTLEKYPQAPIAFEYAPKQLSELGYDAKSCPRFFRDRGYQLNLIVRNGDLTACDDELIESEVTKRGYVDLLATHS